MRVRFAVLLVTLLAHVVPTAASAGCVHVVTPGESLSSIAAADGLTIDQLAAANGLPSAAELLSGSCLTIPPQGGTPQGPATAVVGDGDDDSDDTGVAGSSPASTAVSATPSGGSYVVQPGDTLSAIAARAGMTVSGLAAANGLDPLAPLLSGTVLRLSATSTGAPASPPPASSTPVASSQPVGAAAQGSAVNPPYPTPETVSPSEVGSIAAANGVPPALADAIAYQESGFNNGAVSTADARGVMQILPGTWSWIQQTLVPGASPLAAASATDNIRGGVLLLRSLLNATGGNAALAAAGYYQGLPSVEQNGMLPSTQQYVNNVLALEQRFNGGG